MQNRQDIDERAPLLSCPTQNEPAEESPQNDRQGAASSTVAETATIYTTIPILLFGVFLANADSSLVIATNQTIASEFKSLSSASWLFSSYVLAQSASQPMYGKLSNIFGRKSNLGFSCVSFALGCFICGKAETYWHVLCGRAISGVGAAGIIALTSIVITDIVPLDEVATWRSYVNIIATLGRSTGGPLGGWLSDAVGWRWCFTGQSPAALLALLLVLWQLPNNLQKPKNRNEKATWRGQISRVDFPGSFFLVVTISSFLLTLEFIKNGSSWGLATVMFSAFLASLAAFCSIELRWAVEPILPLNLITKRDVLTSYSIVFFQTIAQFTMVYSVPVYFQAVAGMSVAAAGSRVVPIVVGNTVGGLLSGWMIGWTKRYKPLTIGGIALAMAGHVLVLCRWHGTTSWVETLYVVPTGIGIGTIQSTTFVHLAASLDHADVAIAGSSWFLAGSLGVLSGASLSTLVINTVLVSTLGYDLQDVEDRAKGGLLTFPT